MSKSTSFEKFYSQEVYEGWDELSAFDRVKRLLKAHGKYMGEDRFSDYIYHSTPNSEPVKLVSVTTPRPGTSNVILSYTVPAYYCNGYNNLHGAAQSLLYDNCTTLALAAVSSPGYWMLGGVSRVLDVKYLRPIPLGSKLEIEVECIAAGRNAAALRGVIRDDKGKVLSTCEHDKANVDPPVKAML